MVRTIGEGRPPSGPLTDAERPPLARNRSSLDILLADVENWPIWNPRLVFLPKPDAIPRPIDADRTFPGIDMLFDGRLRPEPPRDIVCAVSVGSSPITSSGGR